MHYLELAVGFVAGVVACAAYNYFFAAKFAKVSAAVIAEYEKVKAKV